MKKTNKKIGKYLIAPIISLFTLVTIGASVGFSPSGSLGSLGNSVAKAKVETAETFNSLKSDDIKVEFGNSFSAAIVDKKLFMWGNNANGQLGIDSTTNQTKPVYVDVDGDKNPKNDNVTDVFLGGSHTLAFSSSNIYVWGLNSSGQLGLGTNEYLYTTPQKLDTSAIGSPVKAALGENHTIVSTIYGLCGWGSNSSGQLGIGNVSDKNAPYPILTGLPDTPTEISAGKEFTTVIASNGLYTWGNNDKGQLGLGDDNMRMTPTQVLMRGSLLKISSGWYHSSIVTDEGFFTWGANNYGQLGLNDTVQRNNPTWVSTSELPKEISLGVTHSSMILSSDLYTWGSNGSGQLGIGSTSQKNTPTKVSITGTPSKVSLGNEQSSVVTSNGLSTTGMNNFGQLGLGNTTNKTSFTLIDHSSNLHKELNILDLTAITDSDKLKEKTVAQVDDAHLINLIKINNSRLFDKYTSDSVITVKNIVKEASYKDGNELFGKIKLTFNNDKQSNWLGPQNINGVKFAIGNIDKEITITKLTKSDTSNSKIIVKTSYDKTLSVDDLIEQIGIEGGTPNRSILDKLIDFKEFPSSMKVTKVKFKPTTPRTDVLLLDLTVDSYIETGTSGETITVTKDTEYLNIKIQGLRIPEQTVIKINIDKDAQSQITSSKIWNLIDATPKNKIDFQKALSEYFDFSTYPDEATFELLNVNNDKKGGKLHFDIKPDRWIDENKVKQIKTGELFRYELNDLKPSLETEVDYITSYDKNTSAEELVKDILKIENKQEIQYNDIKTHPISSYINFFSYPIETNITFSEVIAHPSTGEVTFDITIPRYVNADGDVEENELTLSYTLNVDIIPDESIVEYATDYSKINTPQKLTENLKISEGTPVSDESKNLLKEFIDFKTFPNTFGLETTYVRGDNTKGTLEIGLTSDSWFDSDKFLKKGEKLFEYKFKNLNKQTKISSIQIQSPTKFPKGLQPNNFKNYLGDISSSTHQERLNQFVKFDTFPEGTTFTAIASDPNPTTGKVGLTVSASQFYDGQGYKHDASKTFDEVFITIPMVNDSSKVVERARIPKNLKAENIADFILKNEKSSNKDGESKTVVNVENLDKIFKLKELFPVLETAPDLLKDSSITPDYISEDTQFKITDNKISIDGKTVTFFLEANQIWDESGFFVKMPPEEWSSFKVELQFPGANATWVIIGSSIGAAAVLMLVIIALCNKAKFKALITNKF
ncbi:MAG: RCC1 domain-containing protein [Mycoplasma sp.]